MPECRMNGAPASQTERIKTLARETGFDAVGVTKVSRQEPDEPAILEWINQKRHGSMRYLEDFKKRRQAFFESFPDARSVLVLGVNYFSTEPVPEPTAEAMPQGRVARYAWGRDYHRVLRQKHLELMERLKAVYGDTFRGESCVDTKPLHERSAARQAGLGFAGKNTMLLSREFGPWLFLSEIVTNLDLEPDAPIEGTCGSCVRCQQVCPTGALDEDYRIDARRCIAYLTIEHKGVIPRPLRAQIKNWVFGCDECLNICPFTAGQKQTRWTELEAGAGAGPWLDFDLLFALPSNRAYQRHFAGSALLRANRKQMMRNACLVLGNSGSPKAVPYLRKALEDRAPLVRLHAAWGLGQLDLPEAQSALERRLGAETDPGVLEELHIQLGF